MKKSNKITNTAPSEIDIADMVQSLKDEGNLLDFYGMSSDRED